MIAKFLALFRVRWALNYLNAQHMHMDNRWLDEQIRKTHDA